MTQEEKIIKLSILEERAKQIEQQLILVNQQIIELQNMFFNLDRIKESKGKEILANIGRNIFVKAKLLDENPIVDVGSKVLVKKGVEETKKLVEEQIQEVDSIRQQLMQIMAAVNQELENMMFEIQQSQKQSQGQKEERD